jgi:hypothetical protein
MKLKLSQLKPNPFKKEIHQGKLSQEQVNRIKANIKELGLMGAFPVFKRGSDYFLVNGHHRQEALKQEYGKDFEVECVIHDYTDDKALRGMVIENLTQRNDDFKENVENLVAIRNWLKKNAVREPNRVEEKRKDGRKLGENQIQETGSIRNISDWLNKNGEVMPVTSIQEHLSVHDKLDKDLFNKVEKTHKGSALKRTDENVLSKTQAILLASIEDKKEQKDLAEIMINEKKKDNSEAGGSAVRSQGKQLTAYKKADEEIKEQVRKGKIELKEVPKLVEIKDKEIRNAVIEKEITISQAEDITKINSPKAREKALTEVKQHKRLADITPKLMKNASPELSDAVKNKFASIQKIIFKYLYEARVALIKSDKNLKEANKMLTQLMEKTFEYGLPKKTLILTTTQMKQITDCISNFNIQTERYEELKDLFIERVENKKGDDL